MRIATKKEVKIIKKLFEKYTPEELADAFVFPVLPDNVEQAEKDLEGFRAMRQKQIANQTPEERIRNKMYQIRYQIRDFIDKNDHKEHWNFQYFLNEYIRAQGKKDKEFAEDVDVKPYVLSQYLNGHRSPPKEFLIRLELHSNGLVPASWWFRLLQKSKEAELMQDTAIREQESKHVKNKIELAL
jgi:transcriptional regulator with XRE-family HTH domain